MEGKIDFNKYLIWVLMGLVLFLFTMTWSTPGLTAEPETTVTPIAIPSAGEPIYIDDFSNLDTAWEVTRSQNYNSGYKDGEYEIEMLIAGKGAFNYTNKFIFKTNGYAVQADIRVSAGTPGMYGLFFNFIDKNEKWYQFIVNPVTKCYTVLEKYNNNRNSIPVIDWVESKVIKAAKEKNTLRIEQYNDLVRFFINGEFVDQAIIKLNSGEQKSGVLAFAEEKPVTIRYDNFTLSKLVQPLTNLRPGPVPRYIMVRGNPEGAGEKKMIIAIDNSINYMEGVFGVKLVQPVRIYIFGGKEDFELGMAKFKNMSFVAARETASFAVALSGNFGIYINRDYLVRGGGGDKNYIQEVLCHEIVHVFQDNQFYMGQRRSVVRCLKEGYAYLSSSQMIGKWENDRRDMNAIIKFLVDSKSNIPDLLAIQSLQQYMDTGNQFGMQQFIHLMTAAVELLLEKHGGHKAFAVYFAGGANPNSTDPFVDAFGITPKDFYAEYLAYLQEIAAKTKG
jgi:hypothetical protein